MRFTSFLPFLLGASMAQAEVPRVAVDIAPVHSLVAQVMEGVGEPDLIMRPGASPHHYALRPSEAAALSEADLVIWMGEGLTPWLEGAVRKLAGGARSTALLEVTQTRLLPLREGVGFEHAPHDDHDDHEEHGDPGEHEEHDEHHEHGNMDPHAWLDPDNAQQWMRLIAGELSQLDPDNAERYRQNAERGAAQLEEAKRQISQSLAPVRAAQTMVFHDAYQYFEAAFDIPVAAAISLGDAARPGPARIAALRDLVLARGVTCVLTEPQFDPKLATAILPDGHKTGVLDPMGAGIEPGADLYGAMLQSLADGFLACAP